MMRHPDQRVGVFIDTQNMYYSARYMFNKKVNFGNIVKDAVDSRKLIRAIAYVVKTKTQDESPFFDALVKLGIELREKDLMEYFSGQKKADWDVGLTVDAIRMIDMLDVIVIVSGDGDYIPLVEYVKSRGRIVEIVAFRETTSTRLIEHADDYTNLSENKKRYLITPNKQTNQQYPQKAKVESKQEEKVDDVFFITPDDSADTQDQEESRRKRLSF
ncbi:MAG: NYN domain-containing protein [Patescibacteria group bacterium]